MIDSRAKCCTPLWLSYEIAVYCPQETLQAASMLLASRDSVVADAIMILYNLCYQVLAECSEMYLLHMLNFIILSAYKTHPGEGVFLYCRGHKIRPNLLKERDSQRSQKEGGTHWEEPVGTNKKRASLILGVGGASDRYDLAV